MVCDISKIIFSVRKKSDHIKRHFFWYLHTYEKLKYAILSSRKKFCIRNIFNLYRRVWDFFTFFHWFPFVFITKAIEGSGEAEAASAIVGRDFELKSP